MATTTIVNVTFISPLGLCRCDLQNGGLQLNTAITTTSAIPHNIQWLYPVPQFRPGQPTATSLSIHYTLVRSVFALCSDPLTPSF